MKIMTKEQAIQQAREYYKLYFYHKSIGLPNNLGVPQSAEFHHEGVCSLDNYERIPSWEELTKMGYWKIIFSFSSDNALLTMSAPFGNREYHQFAESGRVIAIVFENGRLFWQTQNLDG